jgi:hypothetical protein
LIDVEDEDDRAVDVREPRAGVGAGEACEAIGPREEGRELELAPCRLDEESDVGGSLLLAHGQHQERSPAGDGDAAVIEPQPRVDDGRRLAAKPGEAEQRRRHLGHARDRRRGHDLLHPRHVDGELAFANVEGEEFHRAPRGEHGASRESRGGRRCANVRRAALRRGAPPVRSQRVR